MRKRRDIEADIWKSLKSTTKIGQALTYNDGRPGHTNHKAVVLNVLSNCFVVQFEDRADTTTIRWDDAGWMRYITFDN
jgi:hypothetical protein